MIVRSAVACETCSHPHTLRIGLGQERAQIHRFACRNCSEEIAVRLVADPTTFRCWIETVENSREITEQNEAPIVNLDANFVIPEGLQGKDLTFHRLHQMRKLADLAEARGTLQTFSSDELWKFQYRPYRSPDYEEEWRLLKRAWTLHHNQKSKLSQNKVNEGSNQFYGPDRLQSLQDWIWRLSLILCQPTYEPIFQTLAGSLEELEKAPKFRAFLEAYPAQVARFRGRKYFDVLDDFFSSYSEFSQVYFLVVKGLDIETAGIVSSTSFHQTKMFYGNTFERFSVLAELFAFLNNVQAGREWNEFERLSLLDYRKLDRANAFNAFAQNAAFAAVCTEADNQIRNASHHDGMRFDRTTGVISYRTGKGGQGEEQALSYTNYLERCVRLFLQTLTLFRYELLICDRYGLPHPL